MAVSPSDDDRPVDPEPENTWLAVAGLLLICACYFVVFLGLK